jgi:glycerol-3-phosphate dehydrogenase
VTAHKHLLSKGVHLIVDRVTKSRRVLTFFADDGRPFFVIPMGPRSCIGTTDTPTDSAAPVVTEEDRRFVLGNINKRLRLRHPLREEDIVAERCGVRPLAVPAASPNGDGAGADWMQLSRKHVVEVDRARRHVSIFGGKLTDCLNVGAEVADAILGFGVVMPRADRRWYGEPPEDVRRDFFRRAEEMGLDLMTSPRSHDKLSIRLWRRYGAAAFGLLEDINKDPKMGQLIIENTEYIRAEVALLAEREMIVTLEDFLRRRSKISLVVHEDILRHAPGLRVACQILFGEDADREMGAYFDAAPPPAPA